jgi:hypothetical protein
MSEQEANDKGLRLIPTWVPVLWAFVAAVFASGSTYATMSAGISEMRIRIDKQEQERQRANEVLYEIRDRLARIEGRLGK